MKALFAAALVVMGASSAKAQSILLGGCTDRSGVVIVGGSAQIAAAPNNSRRTFTLKSPATAPGVLTFSVTGTANAFSFDLPSGASFSWPAGTSYVGAISVYSATSGQAYTLVECQ